MNKPPLQLSPAAHRAHVDGTGLYVIVNADGDQFQFHNVKVANDTFYASTKKCDMYFYTHAEIRDAIVGARSVAQCISSLFSRNDQ